MVLSASPFHGPLGLSLSPSVRRSLAALAATSPGSAAANSTTASVAAAWWHALLDRACRGVPQIGDRLRITGCAEVSDIGFAAA